MQNSYTQTITVTSEQSAQALGSGTLPVLGTPALAALMENTAQKAIGTLPEGDTTVGIALNLLHTKASAIGEKVSCTATVMATEGRKISLHIEATNAKGEIIGSAEHDRFLVNAAKFMGKLTGGL